MFLAGFFATETETVFFATTFLGATFLDATFFGVGFIKKKEKRKNKTYISWYNLHSTNKKSIAFYIACFLQHFR